MDKKEVDKLVKDLNETKPLIYSDPLIKEINHGNGLITILEPKIIDYNHAELIWIRPYYNNIRQSFFFDKMFIIDDRMPKEMFEKIIKKYGDECINKMLKENSYMVECFADYKAYRSRYFVSHNELNLRLLEITFLKK